MNLSFRTLGDVLGSLTYLGSCPRCRTQHMSTHDRVLVVDATEILCERCGYRQLEQVAANGRVPFATWADVLAYAHAGGSLYYKAPLDLQPTHLTKAGKARSARTYEARARTIRICPPGCIGRGRSRRSDPFTADAGHLDRFSRPLTEPES